MLNFRQKFQNIQKIIQKSPKFLNFSWKSAIWWPKNAFFVKILISVNFFFKIHVFQTFFERSVKIGPFSLEIFLKKAFWAQKIAFFHLNFQKAPSGGQNLHFSSFFNKDWRFSTFFLFAFFKKKKKTAPSGGKNLYFFKKKKKERPLVAKKWTKVPSGGQNLHFSRFFLKSAIWWRKSELKRHLVAKISIFHDFS